MNEPEKARATCECGLPIDLPAPRVVSERREFACRCGRLNDLEFAGERWHVTGVLTPEGSVPVSGFSLRLREQPDVRRFWFRHPISPSGQLIGHVVFSGSSREAEVKAADMKAMRFIDVDSPTEARRRWIEHDRSGTRRTGDRPRLRRMHQEADRA